MEKIDNRLNDPVPCRCSYNQGVDPEWKACGEESKCINRDVQIECHPMMCPTGRFCQNRRFQKKQYSRVCVIDAGHKGYGLRVDQDLEP
ncbi:Histone-lysine N-methyltransferase, H3 lysine-36 specific [Smittium culicis]|uniref:Histone-lysine N-methyltransferase, H3 lysine-36 specific n=1 Tax=Smittium culicis TaxID=133412 RepID=A0A1R1XWB5_9FUNG|nr:Histone-lysine N-methyltransferase, H3 lysine-36 specific [Smittium culicis]